MNWKTTLTTLIAHQDLHARFLNMLSMLEYIGARKIMKSQVEESVSSQTLAHIVEEIRHAQILKKFVLKMDPSLVTYGNHHMIAGPFGRNYIQTIDRGIEELLGPGRPWENYLLSTLIIEERANSIYPFYASLLEPLGLAGPIRTILRDEENHLQEIQSELAPLSLLSNEQISVVRALEERAFSQIIAEIQLAIDLKVRAGAQVSNVPH